MKRVRETSSLKLLPLSVLLIVVVLMACGSDDSVVSSRDGDGDMLKVIRLIPSETIFTADDLKAIGWKPQKDLFYDYEGTEVSKWGFLNSKEVGVLIYATADQANTLGVTAADAQTFRRDEDGQAPDDGIDRISCRDAAGQSAVQVVTPATAKAFSASYLEPEPRYFSDVSGRSCSNRFPTYNDYTVIGNVVMMCEGDGRNLLEPSTNCRELEKWLTK